jgi:hypothetical protein
MVDLNAHEAGNGGKKPRDAYSLPSLLYSEVAFFQMPAEVLFESVPTPVSLTISPIVTRPCSCAYSKIFSDNSGMADRRWRDRWPPNTHPIHPIFPQPKNKRIYTTIETDGTDNDEVCSECNAMVAERAQVGDLSYSQLGHHSDRYSRLISSAASWARGSEEYISSA